MLRRLWLTVRHYAQRSAQRRSPASTHLRAVAVALLTGDTSGYRFVPTLPRKPGSTDLYGSTHRGDDAA